MKVCPGCGTSNKDENTFCIGCSKKIEEAVLFCRHCGNKIVSTSKFCISCGNETGGSAAASSPGTTDTLPGAVEILPGATEISQGAPDVSQEDADVSQSVPAISQATIPQEAAYEETQASEIPQVPEKTQIPARKNQPYKKLVVALSVFLPVFFISLAVALVFAFSEVILVFKSPDKPYENRFAADYSLSKDQKTLVNEWGYPDGFLLAMDPDKKERVESWFYYEIGSELIFVNGEYMDIEDLIVYDISKTKDKFMVYPYELTNKVTREGIIEILGPPDTEDVYQDGKLSVMNYGARLVIVLMDKKVIGATLFNTEPDKI